MKLSPAVKATLVVVLLAGALYFCWVKYYAFLNQGRSAPETTQILNKIEKEGVPDFTLKDLKGEELSPTKFKGKLIILNFWASWCDPCVAEFPSLMKLIEHFKGEVVLLAVSADYEQKDIDTFLKAFKVKDPNVHVMWDKDLEVAKRYGTNRLPESYILGRDGKLIRKVAGVDDWSTKDAFSYFEQLLKK